VPLPSDDPRFFTSLLRTPVWLLGGGLMVVGWILQAVALDLGALVVVQPIIMLSLVIALPVGVWLTNQRVGRREWLAAAAAVLGLAVFIAVGNPAEGTQTGDSTAWTISVLVVVGIVVSFVALQRLRHPRASVTAVLFGAASGVCYGFQAAATKVFVGVVGGGLSAILSSWSTYALIASALVGFVLQQSALKTAVLAPAMASTNVANMVVSVVLGAFVFEETLSHGTGTFVVAVAGLSLAVFAVVALTRAQAPEPV
jgi:drug/metabolite transporter (DMT)-like permease